MMVISLLSNVPLVAQLSTMKELPNPYLHKLSPRTAGHHLVLTSYGGWSSGEKMAKIRDNKKNMMTKQYDFAVGNCHIQTALKLRC